MKSFTSAVVVLVGLVSLSPAVLAYPGGAPEGACATLTPEHGVNAQPGNKYGIYVSPNAIQSGGAVSVSLQGQDQMKGFLIVAQDASTGQPIHGGRWTAVDGNAKALSCGLTHTSNSDKPQAQGQWTAPSGFRGQVAFAAAAVKDGATFWNNIRSEILSVQ